MRRKIRIYVLRILVYVCATIFNLLNIGNAQIIKGVVLDSFTNLKIVNCKVSLLDPFLRDSTYTNQNGEFIIKRQDSKKLLLHFSDFLTYDTTINISEQDSIGILDTTTMTFRLNKMNSLKEVTVTSQNKQLQHNLDRWTLLPNLAAAGLNSFELLRLLPGVSINNGSISVNAKKGVQYLINGKISFLPSSSIEDLLKSISPEQILKIELLTTPPAKYSAEGSAAVINIVLKKNYMDGLSGNLSTLYEQGKYHSNRNSMTLNMEHGNFSSSLYGNFNWNNSISDGVETRLYRMASNSPITLVNNYIEKHSIKNFSIFHNIDWQFKHKQWLEVSIQINRSIDNNPLNSLSDIKSGNILDSTIKTESSIHDRSWSYGLNSNYIKKWGDNDKKSVEINAAYFVNRNPNHSTSNYTFVNNNNSDHLYSYIKNDFIGKILGISLDYTSTSEHDDLLESGFKIARLDNNSNFLFNTNLENIFKYTEYNYAAYISKSFSIDSSWKIKVGLRGEYTHYSGNQFENNYTLDSNYFQLFPTVYIQKNISKNIDFSISYSRRISRPDFKSLNPFQYYYDPYSYVTGNPNLKPYFTNTLESSFSLDNVFFLSVGYSNSKNVISDITVQNDSSLIVYSLPNNIAKQAVLYANANANFDIRKWWNSSVSLGFNQNIYKGEIDNYSVDNRILSWNASVYQFFKVKKNWKFSLNGWINGPTTTGIDKYKTIYRLNMSLEKKIRFFTIQAGVNDILKSQYERVRTILGNQDINLIQRHDYRRAFVRIIYKFDSVKTKVQKNDPSRKSEENFSSEENRVQ